MRFFRAPIMRVRQPEIDMKRSLKLLFLGPVLSLLACGGGGGGDPGSDLTPAEVNSISAALVGSMNGSSGGGSGTSLVADRTAATALAYSNTCSSSAWEFTAVPNDSYSCPGGGRISYTGNLKTSCTAWTYHSSPVKYCSDCSSWYTANSLTFQVSDPTNNLNDCDVGNGVILDGTLYLTATGTGTNIDISMTGTIGVDRRGPTGGLVPITSDCSIFIYYTAATGKTTGSICGHPISS